MKFVAKSTNLHIILRPSLPGNTLTGQAAVSGLSVRFIDGIATVNDEKTIEMMLNHSGFGMDYIQADNLQTDPYLHSRQASEPDHVITEMAFGSPTGRIGSRPTPIPLTPEVKKYIADLAFTQAKEMLPGLLKAAISELAGANKAADVQPTETTSGSIDSGSIVASGTSSEHVLEDDATPLAKKGKGKKAQ